MVMVHDVTYCVRIVFPFNFNEFNMYFSLVIMNSAIDLERESYYDPEKVSLKQYSRTLKACNAATKSKWEKNKLL